MIDPISLSVLSLLASFGSFIVAFLAYREATKGPDIILIAEEEKEVQVNIIIRSPAHAPSISGRTYYYYEAYITIPLIFLNRGSKGGAIIDIQPEITNLPSGEIPEFNVQIEKSYNFKDGLGNIIDPRFFLPSIDGRESIPVSLEYAIRLYVPRLELLDIREVFRDRNDVLKVKINYKKVHSDGKLHQESKLINLKLHYE